MKRNAIVLNNYFWFTRGFTFSVDYHINGFGYAFTGICLRTKRKSLFSNTSTFLLRNVFARIAVELHLTLYCVCRLKFKMLYFARKKLKYWSAKLYYLRNKLNVESLVKL